MKEALERKETVLCPYATKHSLGNGIKEDGCFLATSSCSAGDSFGCKMYQFRSKKILIFKQLLSKRLEGRGVLLYDNWYKKVTKHFHEKCFISEYFLLRAEDEVVWEFLRDKR